MCRKRPAVAAVAAALIASLLAIAPSAGAQDPGQIIDQSAIEQSCRSLDGGTVNSPDEAPADPSGGLPVTWPEAPAGLLPDHIFLRTPTQTFNRLYEFATANGQIYGRRRGDEGPWRELPLPLCFAGHVASISLDDDEMIALDTGRRVFTMDNALKDSSLFNWSRRWGPPTWTGPGYTLPSGVIAWSWSVISRVEDHNWTDPAGNRTQVGDFKVSHIWGLRDGGQRLTFWDPWLPLDESYEMCGPHRGRFKAVNMSASGSFVFVVGAHGDMFTRIYDFDLSGHDPVFFHYSYEDQRGKGDGAPIQLPAAPWVQQPKIPGEITSAISIHKVGVDAVHRILRVEGRRAGQTGYWERDVASPAADGWTFHATGQPLTGTPLANSPGDTSELGLGRGEDNRYEMRTPDMTAELLDYNVYCSPARLRIEQGGKTRELRLHSVDGLRQSPRARGLDDEPRQQFGAIEEPGGKFTDVTIQATRDAVVVEDRGWRFTRVVPGTPAARRCLPRRARIGSRSVGPLHLRLTKAQVLHRLPAPRRHLPHAWVWCVDGGGQVAAVFSKAGRVALVTTTAPRHSAGSIHPRSRLRAQRRVYRVARSLVRTSRSGSRLLGTRRGRIRFVAVASPRTIADRKLLRSYLRSAGFPVRGR